MKIALTLSLCRHPVGGNKLLPWIDDDGQQILTDDGLVIFI